MIGRAQIQFYAPAADRDVTWRLLSGNNREAGRGLATAQDLAGCRRSVEILRAAIGDARPRVRRAPGHRWVWELALDDVPVAYSARPFDRLIRCQQGLDHFVSQFAVATIPETLVVSGARRFGTMA